MEIKMKTLDGVRESYVSITVRNSQEAGERVTYLARDNAEVIILPDTVDGEVSTMTVPFSRFLDLTDQAGRVPALELQVTNLETALRLKEDRIDELSADLKAAQVRAGQWDLDRHTEQRRADENREWAKHAEANLTETLIALEDSRALVRQRDAIIHEHAKDLIECRDFRLKEREEARKKVEELTLQLDRVRAAVRGVAMDQAVETHVNHADYSVRHMARRLRRIRAIVALPEAGAEQDNQA